MGRALSPPPRGTDLELTPGSAFEARSILRKLSACLKWQSLLTAARHSEAEAESQLLMCSPEQGCISVSLGDHEDT